MAPLAPRRRMVLIVAGTLLVGLIVGGVAGAYIAAEQIGQVIAKNELNRTGADMRLHVLFLKNIRAEQPEKGIGTLEAILDGDILSYGALTENGEPISPTADVAIREARKYRAQFPRKSGASKEEKEIEQMIDGILAAVTEMNHEDHDAKPSPRP